MWFREIEQIVGTLPASARQYRPWWGNSTHAHALSWQRAGWKVDTVILTSELVVFVRGQAERRSPAPDVTALPAHGTITIRDSASGSEAEVQARLVTYLASQGWQVQRVADTHTRERGIDIVAARGGRTLAVEVKGYPSTKYADPRRANETKSTIPSNQARQWFSHALLKALLMRDEHPAYEIAMAFPDVSTYRRLAGGVAQSLGKLDVDVIFVRSDATVNWLKSGEGIPLEEAVDGPPKISWGRAL